MLANAVPSLLRHVRRLAASASSDEQLLADYLARRSDEAFAALLGRHGPMVFNVCRRILHDAHAAEDVFQATFLVLADRAGAIRRRTSLAGFLHGVAYRLAVRARRRRVQSLPDAVCDKTAQPTETLAWQEMLGILDQELSRLSDRYRAPLVLCYLQGRTQDEAARQLGWGLNTLRRRVAQGRRLLEARLRGRGVTLSAALAGLLAAQTAAVSGPLQAATLAAVCAPLASGLTGGAFRLWAPWKTAALSVFATGKKLVALAALAAFGVAVCLACWWPSHSDQAPPAHQPAATAPAGARRGEPADDPLPARSFVRLGTARYRPGSPIWGLSVSADGKLAAVSSGYSSYYPARVFDLTDGRCLYSLPLTVRGYSAEAVGLSPDGKILATRDSKFVCFRDAATGKELHKVKYLPAAGGSRSVTDWITFTPDGKHVAVTLMGDAVQLIDVRTGAVIRTFEKGAGGCACVFSADGKWMASGGYDGAKRAYFVRLWEVATGKELRRFPVGSESILVLAFSPDGAMLAGGCWWEGRLRLWEAATGKEHKVFPKIGREIRGVAFTPDGKTVAAAGDHIHLYDPSTGKERLQIARRARGLAFSRDGSVLTGAVSGAIYRWDPASGRQLTPTAGQDSAVEQILVSPDGRRLFTTDQEGNLYLWETAGGKPPRRLAGGVERGVVASPDGRLLAWVTAIDEQNPDPTGRKWNLAASQLRFYDVAAGRLIDRLPGFQGGDWAVGFLPDGKTLLTLDGGRGNYVARLWDVGSGKERRSFLVPAPKQAKARPRPLIRDPRYTTRQTALSPDGNTLAIGPYWPESALFENYPASVRLWDVATGKAGHQLKTPRAWVNPTAADEPGAALESSREVNQIMKAADGRAFSPDGRFLADWAQNPRGRSKLDHAYVWHVPTGRPVAALVAGPRPGAANAAWSPDGRTLATASADGTVRLWEVATWTVRAELRGHRDRVTALAFGPGGRLYTGGLDTTVLGWDVKNAAPAAR